MSTTKFLYERMDPHEQELVKKFRKQHLKSSIAGEAFDLFSIDRKEMPKHVIENINKMRAMRGAEPLEELNLGDNINTFADQITSTTTAQQYIDLFFKATHFGNQQGMLYTLHTTTGINRDKINSHPIRLKDFANAAAFFQLNLENNPIGKHMIPIIVEKFIQQIDRFMQGIISDSPTIQASQTAWKDIKEHYSDKRFPISLNEFLTDVQTLFLQTLNDEDVLLKIYPKIAISIRDISEELRAKQIIPENEYQEAFKKKNARGPLEQSFDVLITGDTEKSREILREKENFDTQFFNRMLTSPLPTFKEIGALLTKENRTSPIDSNIQTPTSEVFREALQPFKEVLKATPETLQATIQTLNTTNNMHFRSEDEVKTYVDKLIAKFNEANSDTAHTSELKTLEELETSSDREINHYLIQDARNTKSTYPQNNEERNTLFHQVVRQKGDSLLNQLPQDSPEFKKRATTYMRNIEYYTRQLLDPNEKKIAVFNYDGTEAFSFDVEKHIGKAIENGGISGDEPLDMTMDIVNISEEAHKALTDKENSPLLQTKYFPITDTTGEKAISPDYTVKIKTPNFSAPTGSGANTEMKGHLTENINPNTPIPASLQHEINRIKAKQQQADPVTGVVPEDTLLYLLDDNGNIINAYSQKELENSEVDITQKKLHLEGDDLQKFLSMMLIYQLGNLDGTSEHTGELKDALDQLQDQQVNPDQQSENKEHTHTEFRKFLRDMAGYNFAKQANITDSSFNDTLTDEQLGLKEGNSFRIQTRWESELPPKDQAADQSPWLQMEIIDANAEEGNSVQVKLSGGELPLGNGLEGKKLTFPKDSTYRTKFLEIMGGGEYYKLPPSKKTTGEKPNLEDCANNFRESGINGGFFGQLTSDHIHFEGNKIKFNQERDGETDVEYFAASEDYLTRQDEKADGGDYPLPFPQSIRYKVEYKDGQFEVSSEFVNDNEGNGKKYKQTMDYNNLLLFLTTKQLKPLSTKMAEQQKEADEKRPQAGLPTKKRTTFSIKNLLHAGKNIYTTWETKWKEYSKQREEDLMDWAVGDLRIYDLAGGIMNFFDWTGGAEGAARANIEYRGNRMNRSYDKVKRWQELLQKDGDRGWILKKKNYLPSVIGKDKSILDFIMDNERAFNPNDRFFLAAILLTQIKKGKSPYRNMPEYQWNGQWIKLLLGEEHQQNFLRQRDLKRKEAENEGGGRSRNKQITKDMAQAEMLYLVNIIDDRAVGNDSLFGNLPKDKFPNKGDSTVFKRRLGPQFAKDLEAGLKEAYFVDFNTQRKKPEVSEVRNFSHHYREFRRFAHSGRYGIAMPHLAQMGCMAKTDEQKKKLKCALLLGLTSGIFRNSILPEVQDELEKLSRTLGFVPGMKIITPLDHPSKVVKLLDFLTDPTVPGNENKRTKKGEPLKKFSETIEGKRGEKSRFKGWKRDDFDNTGGRIHDIKYADYFDAFEKYWHEYDSIISNGVKNLPMVDVQALPSEVADKYGSTVSFYQAATEDEQVQNINKDVFSNDAIAQDNALGQSKSSILQVLFKYSGGRYINSNVDEEQAQQEFWKAAKRQIEEYKQSPRGLAYLIKRIGNNWFESRGFDSTGKEKVVRTLKCVADIIKKGDNNAFGRDDFGNEIPKSQVKNILNYMITGRIFGVESTPPLEIQECVMAFTDAIWEGLNSKTGTEPRIDDAFIKDCFPGYEEFFTDEKKYHYINWNVFIQRNNGTTEERNKANTDYQKQQDSLVNYEMERTEGSIKNGNLGFILNKPDEGVSAKAGIQDLITTLTNIGKKRDKQNEAPREGNDNPEKK